MDAEMTNGTLATPPPLPSLPTTTDNNTAAIPGVKRKRSPTIESQSPAKTTDQHPQSAPEISPVKEQEAATRSPIYNDILQVFKKCVDPSRNNDSK
jgi:hypothetical protein